MGTRMDSGWGDVAARGAGDVRADAGLVAPARCAPTWPRRATGNRICVQAVGQLGTGTDQNALLVSIVELANNSSPRAMGRQVADVVLL